MNTQNAQISREGSAFAGKVALVTGAGRGVGQAIAQELFAGGASVAVSDINTENCTHTANTLDETGARAMSVSLDVRKKEDFESALAKIVDKWGKVDIVVNNAGYAKRTPAFDITAEEFDDIMAINMRSVFFSCQVFAQYMMKQKYGRIINITSLAGQNGGTVASPHYASSKAGAIMLTKYFAQLCADSGVTVNSVCPGPIATAKGRLSDEQIKMIEGRVPVGRFCEASEIAASVALLASDRGGFFVGATLDMNGGLYVR